MVDKQNDIKEQLAHSYTISVSHSVIIFELMFKTYFNRQSFNIAPIKKYTNIQIISHEHCLRNIMYKVRNCIKYQIIKPQIYSIYSPLISNPSTAHFDPNTNSVRCKLDSSNPQKFLIYSVRFAASVSTEISKPEVFIGFQLSLRVRSTGIAYILVTVKSRNRLGITLRRHIETSLRTVLINEVLGRFARKHRLSVGCARETITVAKVQANQVAQFTGR